MLREQPVRRLTRRALHLIDAALAALYIAAFGLTLYSLLPASRPEYRLETTATLVIIEALLFIVGWRNTTIHLGEKLCILYRNGFIPLYTAVFTLAAWIYYWAPMPPSALEALAVGLVAPYALYRALGERAIAPSVIFAPLTGAAVYALYPHIDILAVAFSAPQIAIAFAKPRLLCDDRPVLIVNGLYALIGALIVYAALTLHAP